MIRVSQERSPFAQDLCRCSRCNGLLSRYDIAFDWLGRTVERCPRCGPTLLHLHVGALRLKRKPAFTAKPCGKCADCPRKLVWRGTGARPTRCASCQRERGRVRDLKYYHATKENRPQLLAGRQKEQDHRAP